ncbi:glycosyltransferase [Candidatus Pacearchaeota archaeon]|nr:glycosyltransferase [Candidatus Pacearchaeota archaeon]
MISIIITSFKEPKTIGKAIQSFLDQDIKDRYEILVVAPDKETLDVAKSYSKKYIEVKIFKDPGKGKMFALNILMKTLKSEIFVLSDGDVFVEPNSLKYILLPFKDSKVGVVTGRPVSLDSKKKMLGYWSHLLCDAGAHGARLKRAKKGKFVECSGYYWAFRNNVVKDFPLDVPEDAIIPIYFWQKGYKVVYASEAIVYVKYPSNLHDFIDQKKRTTKAHVQMSKYVDFNKIPKTKTFTNELLESYRAFLYPRNFKEMLWTFLLFPVKLYIWCLSLYHVKISKKYHKDAWKVTKSTK